jgi:kynurenine formamidase
MTRTLVEQLGSARVYDLEQMRFPGMPLHPAHRPGYFYALHRRHRDGYRPAEHGSRSGASGMLTMMEHSGTHLDALCHQSCDLTLFGGVPVDRVETPSGFKELGVETVPPLIGRGVLLDVAGWMGVAELPAGYAISDHDLIACAAAQKVVVRSGDIALVRTGNAVRWNDEAAYLKAAGVAKSGTIWVAERGVVAVGADNMMWDAPEERDPETGSMLFAHVHLLTRKGIYIMENLNLENLARDRSFEFGFVGIPLKLRGATGSPIRPLALVENPVA